MLLSRFAFSACLSNSTIASLVQPSLVPSFQIPQVLDCVGSGLKVSNSFLERWTPDDSTTIQIDEIFPFIQHFGPQSNGDPAELSVGVWFTPEKYDPSAIQPILSFDKPFDGQYWVGCPGYQLQISIYYDNLLVTYAEEDENLSCRYLNDISVGNSLTQVIVSFSGGLSVFVNGRSALHNPANIDLFLDSWSKVNALSFFATPHLHFANIFRGTIHQVDFWDEAINETTAASLFDENVTILVDNLVVQAPSETTLSQGTSEPVAIEIGCDSFLDLELRIIKFPAFGYLTTEFDTNITQDDRFSVDSAVSFNYTLNDSRYFNVPTTNVFGDKLRVAQEYFTYQIEGIWNGESVVSSDILKHRIIVTHSNHKPTLTAPVDATLDPYADKFAVVHGINYNDELDLNMDKVLVEVFATHRLQLFHVYESLADFSCSQCVDRNNTLAFVAVPDSVNAILRGLYYERPDNVPDKIEIRIHDGPTCLETNGDCFVVQATVFVNKWHPPVDEDAESEKRIERGGLYGKLARYVFITWGLIAVTCVSVGITKCIRRCARGSRTEAD